MEKLIRLYPINARLSYQPSRLVYMTGEQPAYEPQGPEQFATVAEGIDATMTDKAGKALTAAIHKGDGSSVWEASKGLAGALWNEKVSKPIARTVDANVGAAIKTVDESIVGEQARLMAKVWSSEEAQQYAQIMDPRTAYKYWTPKKEGVLQERLKESGAVLAEVLDPTPVTRPWKKEAQAVAKGVKGKVEEVTGVADLKQEVATLNRKLVVASAALNAKTQGDVVKALAKANQLGSVVSKTVKTKDTGLNVRDYPSRSAPMVTQVAKGETVKVNTTPPGEVISEGYVWNYSADKKGWIAAGRVGQDPYLA
ncbi:MAG: SH3 domain-containing protein [Candidatus Gracilibacteria bacterium]